MKTLTVTFSPVRGKRPPTTVLAPAGECAYWAARILALVPDALTVSYTAEASTIRPFSQAGLWGTILDTAQKNAVLGKKQGRRIAPAGPLAGPERTNQ